MTKITTFSLPVPSRPRTVAAPESMVAKAAPPVAPAVIAPKPVAPVAPAPAPQAPQIQTIAAATLTALIAEQSHAQAPLLDPQRTHGADSLHGHAAAPPPVTLPPVSLPPVVLPSIDPNPSQGQDDLHGHKPPPVVEPPPAPKPAPVPNFDAGLPAKTIAMLSDRLKDSAVQAQARATFVAQRAEERAQTVVGQGKAALAIFQAMEAEWQQWQDHGKRSDQQEPFRPLSV